jgi:anaerobic selenocysteine-containing dehydrogenase
MVFRELARRMGLTLPDGEEIRAMVEGLFGTAGAPVRLHAVRLPEERPRVKGLLLDPSPQLFHSGSTTTHSAILEELSPGIALRMAPVDAQAAGLGNGDVARLVTGGREVLLRARIDRRVRPGTVMAPWRTWNDGAARLITSEGEVVQVRLRRS